MTVVNPENFLQIVPYVKGNDQGYIFFTQQKTDLHTTRNMSCFQCVYMLLVL